MTIENPCYHCYMGATGQCYMTGCKHQLKSWAKDLDREEIDVEEQKGEKKNDC